MFQFWWRRRVITKNSPGSVEDLRHEIRNAVMGIQLERKQIAQCLLKIGQHQARIEGALNGAGK